MTSVVIVPAFMSQGGAFRRGWTVALCVGLLFGVQAWLDSGTVFAGVVVLVTAVLVLVVAVATTLWDAALGSVGNAAASFVYLVIIGLELFWWPHREEVLLANADRAVAMVETAPG